jgi:hypothetical protein
VQPFTFTVTAKGPIAAVWSSVKAASKDRIVFHGDDASGSFSGLVSGTYTASGQDIAITVTQKPFFVSDHDIEKAVRQFFQAQ